MPQEVWRQRHQGTTKVSNPTLLPILLSNKVFPATLWCIMAARIVDRVYEEARVEISKCNCCITRYLNHRERGDNPAALISSI